MWSTRRRILSQNFLTNRKLIEKLVRKSSIGLKDTVLEIGPGRGIVTEYLVRKSKRVIAVELDRDLYFYLKSRFRDYKNKLVLINKDILECKLPNYPYKVFSNIPFSIEGKIIRRLLNAEKPPSDCYLVVRKEFAERVSGSKKESQFSIFYKPWFSFEIVHYFSRYDFDPSTRVDSVLLRFTKREIPLVNRKNMRLFNIFVGQGFGAGRNIKYNLRTFLSYRQLKRFAKQHKFNIKSKPSDLTLDQWISLFIASSGLF